MGKSVKEAKKAEYGVCLFLLKMAFGGGWRYSTAEGALTLR